MTDLRYRARDAAIRFGRILKTVATVTAFAGLIAGALGAYSYLTSTPRLAIHNIVVENADAKRWEEIEALTGVRIGDNLVATDLSAVRSRVEDHPWVAHATVTRDLPHTLRIVVDEREPALILSLDQLYYVDVNGVAFKPVAVGDNYDFPVLTGLTRRDFEHDPEFAADILRDALRILDAAETSGALENTEISELHVEHDEFTLTTVDASLVVRIGSGGFSKKFKRLERVRSAGGTAHARHVDLRFDSQVVVAP